MVAQVYEQHDKHFARVAAYIVMLGSEKVAKVAIKFPQDGAGRLYAYVHWYGLAMQRGSASGYGYDKRSAAIADAMRKAKDPEDITRRIPNPDTLADYDRFRKALSEDSGRHWDDRLRAEGFEVHQAI